MTTEGFVPVGAKQSATRTEGKADFTKHLIRLRRVDDGKNYHVRDTVCEILLKNANDGTSAYELMAGLFRIRCLNSLVTQTGTIEETKVRHSGDVQSNIRPLRREVFRLGERQWNCRRYGGTTGRVYEEPGHLRRAPLRPRPSNSPPARFVEYP
ncbi:DUF932 domain-containing protein [Agrobacterium tumefaciens]|uniref:DUF932 domain-containing protein n=1 Tax=Agrobacterium tumefaciens TaxID=358 RepID=UPI003BB889FB